jgi:hypothetical protein
VKPRNREVNIFNMSVLDLLTGALGAFCFLTLALFPYYFKATSAAGAMTEADARQAAKAAEQLKSINVQLKSELASAQANERGMPPFAMATAFASVPNQASSCAVFQVADYSGPGGQEAIKLLPTAGSNGFDSSLDLFLLAPGNYSVTFSVAPTSLPCTLYLSVFGAAGVSQASAVLNTRVQSPYTLTFSVASQDLSFADVMK